MKYCRNCGRYTRLHYWCSAVACHEKGQRQAEVDARALANNPRWLAAVAERQGRHEAARAGKTSPA